jgi:hypothetical protein
VACRARRGALLARVCRGIHGRVGTWCNGASIRHGVDRRWPGVGVCARPLVWGSTGNRAVRAYLRVIAHQRPRELSDCCGGWSHVRSRLGSRRANGRSRAVRHTLEHHSRRRSSRRHEANAMSSNTALEADRDSSWPRCARNELRARQRGIAAWPAAQLGR